VLEPARRMARDGIQVHLFGLGVRKFEALRHFRSFVRELEPGLIEERMVSPWNWLDFLRRGRSGLPPLHAAPHVAKKASRVLLERMSVADVIQYESPWLFDFHPAPGPRILIAHNMELDLLRSTTRASSGQLALAAEIEGRAWREADVTVCLTEADRRALSATYGERVAEVIPLGVDLERHRPADAATREEARRRLRVEGRFVVLFTGAWHLPNQSAMKLLREEALELPKDWLVVCAGTVSSRPVEDGTFLATGPVADLGPWFAAADCAVNPMVEGSGANVKLLEYLARGLPVVTTPFGARGMELTDGHDALIVAPEDLSSALHRLREEPEFASALGAAGRALVERERSWEAITRRRIAACFPGAAPRRAE